MKKAIAIITLILIVEIGMIMIIKPGRKEKICIKWQMTCNKTPEGLYNEQKTCTQHAIPEGNK